MKKFISLFLIVSVISACQKHAEPLTVQTNLEEQLMAPGLGGNYWTLKLFAPSWIGRRSGMSCFVIGGYAYLFGGYDHTNPSFKKDLFRYDPVNNVYSQQAGMPYPGLSRQQAVAFTISNKGYIATGYGVGPLNDLWEYDPAAGMGGTWTKKADLPAADRWRAIGFSINNKGYIATGNTSNNQVLKDIWEYDPVADSWTQKTSMPTVSGRDEAFVFVIGSKAYIGGGNTPGQLPSFWEFDPAAGANGLWTQKATYPGLAKEKISAYSTSTSGYAGSGSRTEDGVTVYYQDFWKYHPSTNTWTQRKDFPRLQTG